MLASARAAPPGALPSALRLALRPLSSPIRTSASPSSASDGGQGPQSPSPPPLPPLPSAADATQHWLERHFPGVRQWLEAQNRRWWIKGLVEARCKQYHQLEGRESELRRLIEAEYLATLCRWAGSRHAVDERAETHLQVAALALASHKALAPWLRDEAEVLQIIREHMGGRTHAALRFLLRATRLLHRDPYAVLQGRLRALQWDLGRGFESRLELGERQSSLTVSRCLYAEVFKGAGQPQLAACCCCSQDAVWFDAAQYSSVTASRTAAISAGDRQCCFLVRRTAAAGEVG